MENDVLDDTGENYSNGISLSLSHRGTRPVWAFLELVWHECPPTRNARFQAQMTGPVLWSYAGKLNFSASTQIRFHNQFHGLRFVTSVVGP